MNNVTIGDKSGGKSSGLLPTINSKKNQPNEAAKTGVSQQHKPPSLNFESSDSDEEKQKQDATEKKLQNFVSIASGLREIEKASGNRIGNSKQDRGADNKTLDPIDLEGLQTSRKHQQIQLED